MRTIAAVGVGSGSEEVRLGLRFQVAHVIKPLVAVKRRVEKGE